jgi:hypothetical protein
LVPTLTRQGSALTVNGVPNEKSRHRNKDGRRHQCFQTALHDTPEGHPTTPESTPSHNHHDCRFASVNTPIDTALSSKRSGVNYPRNTARPA